VIGADESGAVSLRLPRDPGPVRDYLGRDVILGIRPECIAEADRRFGAGGSDSVQLDAAVEMTEPTGAETIVVLRLGGERVLGRVAPDVKLTPGRPARFTLDLRTLCLFDPATEELIA
jgi:multiple sugar transport system ATP-binding protein